MLNPRRDDWDSSWIQDPKPGTKFYEQVTWELNSQEDADILIYYFAPNTISPITLLELGYFMGMLRDDQSLFVYNPKEYDRSGNVNLTVSFHTDRNPKKNVFIYDDTDKLIEHVKEVI